jgi:hypothetical protein
MVSLTFVLLTEVFCVLLVIDLGFLQIFRMESAKPDESANRGHNYSLISMA